MGELQVYEDTGGRWRWRLRAGNGQTQAVSGESFASKSNAKRAARRVAGLLAVVVPVVVL